MTDLLTLGKWMSKKKKGKISPKTMIFIIFASYRSLWHTNGPDFLRKKGLTSLQEFNKSLEKVYFGSIRDAIKTHSSGSNLTILNMIYF